MLNLITSNSLKQELANRVEILRTLTVTVRIPSQLHRFLSLEFSKGFPKEGVTLDFNTYDSYKFLEQMVKIYPNTLLLKSTYLAVWIALTRCFNSASLHDYLSSIKEEKELLYFPHIDWSVEQDGKIVETNLIYSYIGSDLLIANPSRMVLSHPRSIFSDTDNSFAIFTMERSRIAKEWRTKLDDSLGVKAKTVFQSLYQLVPDGPGPSSLFRTESELTGQLEIYAKVATPKTKLSFFYSIADRVLSQSIITAKEGHGEISFNLLENMMNLVNPTLENPDELKTSVFFADKHGNPKFAFLANP